MMSVFRELRKRSGGTAIASALTALLLSLASEAVSQPAASMEERRLAFAEAEIAYREAERKLTRARELHEGGLLSQAALETEEMGLRLANVQVTRTWLRLALADPEIVLRSARKYRSEDGQVRVELDLAARWSSGPDMSALPGDVSSSLVLPAVEGIANVVVSLKTIRGYREGVLLEPTIVSVPYEQRIARMRFDEPVTVDFGLLVADVQELLVELRYHDSVHERQVLLGQGAGSGSGLIVRSEQITLDAELGAAADYELGLERFDDASAIYGLTVDGLPPEVAWQVSDPESGAAFSQVFFPEQVTRRNLQLRLTMPSRPTEAVQPGRPIRFAVRLEPDGLQDNELGQSAASTVDLAVIPRGVAELQVDAANLYHEVPRGESVQFDARIVNSGSRILGQVELTVALPFGWKKDLTPRLLPSLAPGASETVSVILAPPADVLLGDYEGSVQAGSLSGDRLVESDPKTLRLHVVDTGNPWLTALLFLALGGALGAVILAGLKLSRR